MRSMKRIALCCSMAVMVVPAAFAENWKVAKDEDGIQVSLSEVQGSDFKAFKGVTVIKAPVAKITALQEDAAGSCKWIYQCEMQRVLKQEGNLTWTYARITPPWPVGARDSILQVSTSKAADGTVTRTLVEQPTYMPPEKGYVRVDKVDGFWKLVPKGPNSTEVTYQVHTEPGGKVPSFVANKFVVDAPFNTLKGLRELAEK